MGTKVRESPVELLKTRELRVPPIATRGSMERSAGEGDGEAAQVRHLNRESSRFLFSNSSLVY